MIGNIRAYVEAAYFYRPLRWDAGYWRFGIYARYHAATIITSDDHRSYNVYNGAHSWANEWREEVGITEEKSSTAEIITADMA